MKRYLLKIEYLGKNFAGWQLQKNAPSLQGELERALEAVFGEQTKTFCSGRTDAGVNAYAQYVHFDTKKRITPQKLVCALNHHLNSDIAIKQATEVSLDFDARFNVKKKTYIYKILNSATPSPLKKDLSWHIGYALDQDKMNQCAKMLIGRRDFAHFCSAGSYVVDTVRTIFDASVKREGEEIEFRVVGNGFLYNMVRIMTMLLVNVGSGRLSLEQAQSIIESGVRSQIKGLAPPQGLYLFDVEY